MINLKFNKKGVVKNKDSGITLISLVVTIIVLLILAGISISMLSGDNSILQKTTDAKIKTERESIIEQAKIDILGYYAENKGGDIEKAQLKSVLDTYFKDVPNAEDLPDGEELLNLELTTLDKYGIHKIKVSEIFDGNLVNNNTVTFGEKYDEYEDNDNTMIGKSIDYTSENNNITDWIILGKQINNQGKNDIIITTKNPVSTQTLNRTLAGWCGYEDTINEACSSYVGQEGTLGSKSAQIVEVRSINLDDINSAVGFTPPETFDEVVFGEDNNFYYPDETYWRWINPATSGTTWPHTNDGYSYVNDNGIYKYSSSKMNNVTLTSTNLGKSENMKYILTNSNSYWVASRSVKVSSSTAYFGVAYVYYGVYSNDSLCYSNSSRGQDAGASRMNALRPVVVLSSEIPWNDVKDLIGEYVTYTYDDGSGNGGSGSDSNAS